MPSPLIDLTRACENLRSDRVTDRKVCRFFGIVMCNDVARNSDYTVATKLQAGQGCWQGRVGIEVDYVRGQLHSTRTQYNGNGDIDSAFALHVLVMLTPPSPSMFW